MTLKIGEKAIDFSLLSDEGKLVSLKANRGKKVVLYFYPKDNTPGCTREACDFRDSFSQLQNNNVEIIGISKDTPTSHQNFKKKYNLPFVLLSDRTGEVCEAYGIMNKKILFGKSFLGIERATFLIDENGYVQAIWRKVKVAGHIQQILDAINQK